MKVNGVIGVAALGLVTRSAHPHWHEVNPIKRQTLDEDEQREAKRRIHDSYLRTQKRQAEIKRKGGRILPVRFKV